MASRRAALEWSVSQEMPVTRQRQSRVAQAAVTELETHARLMPLLIQATEAFYRL